MLMIAACSAIRRERSIAREKRVAKAPERRAISPPGLRSCSSSSHDPSGRLRTGNRSPALALGPGISATCFGTCPRHVDSGTRGQWVCFGSLARGQPCPYSDRLGERVADALRDRAVTAETAGIQARLEIGARE